MSIEKHNKQVAQWNYAKKLLTEKGVETIDNVPTWSGARGRYGYNIIIHTRLEDASPIFIQVVDTDEDIERKVNNCLRMAGMGV